MGTLKLIGESRLTVEDIPLFLQARNRQVTGPTAPPQGLYLKSIAY
jgi:tRNA pseudouridine38-40 synthase